ncbi:MAG: hypothetical protein M1819_006034 [Sarea resinae]|nr:MAG: hypothetical protein M1819_006034 [Sarea resinae]
MFAQRVAQQSMRRFAVQQPCGFAKSAIAKFAAPAAVATSNYVQTRPVATQNVKHDEAYQILVDQRKNRPISPHLTIYRPQVTWYLSGLNRITGSVLGGGLYIFGAAYLVSPLFGWHLESTALAETFGALSTPSQVAIKTVAVFPFAFHSLNGVRHLIWDLGYDFKNKQVQRSGWISLGLSVVASGYLAWFI